MFPRLITYKNPFTGKEAEREYWFGISGSEVAELKLVHKKDITEYFDRIIETEDNRELIVLYRELLQLGVGVRNGHLFDKSPEVQNEFVQSGAYDSLFLELIQSKDQGAGFINDMFPKDLIDKYNAEKAQRESKTYTDDELLSMSNKQFKAVAGDWKNMDKHMHGIAMRRKEMSRNRHLTSAK
jgi:hypothetical protein